MPLQDERQSGIHPTLLPPRINDGEGPDGQFQLHAVELRQLQAAHPVDHREALGQVRQELRTELRDRLVGDGQGAPPAQTPRDPRIQPADRTEFQHAIGDHRDQIAAFAHECAGQRADGLVPGGRDPGGVVVHPVSTRRLRRHLGGGHHHQLPTVRAPGGQPDAARRPGHHVEQPVAGDDLHVRLGRGGEQRPEGGHLRVAQVQPHARLTVSACEGVDGPEPAGLRVRHPAVPAVAQPVPLHARRFPAAALTGHHDPRLEPIAQPRLDAARGVRTGVVRHQRQLQPDHRTVRDPRPVRVQGPQRFLGLPAPRGGRHVPLRLLADVQHDRRRVLAVHRHRAGAQCARGPGRPVRIRGREVDRRGIPPRAAALDLGGQAVALGAVGDAPDPAGVRVSTGAPQGGRTHQGLDLGLGDPHV